MAPIMFPTRQKLSAGLRPTAIFATARWISGAAAVTSTRSRTDHRRGATTAASSGAGASRR